MTRRLLAVSLLFLLLLSTTPITSAVSSARRRAATDNMDQHTWLTALQSYAALGAWLMKKVLPRSERGREMRVAPPVTAFLNAPPFFIDAPANLTITTVSDTSVSMSWTAAAGSVDHYQIERSPNIFGSFVFLGNATGTTYTDVTASTDHSYLYRVRTVAIGGALSAPGNVAYGTAATFEFNSLLGQSVRAQHFYDVRTAINAVRAAANLSAATWTRSNLTGLDIHASDVQEMRDKLGEALTALGVSVSPYTDPTLTPGTTPIKAIHLEELQARSTRGSGAALTLDSDSSTARLDALNETGGGGENPLSRNFNWVMPLVDLPGRAGMDLSFTLSYNSLLWTRNGNYITFDPDRGFPGPGFRLGFPVIQAPYFNTEVGKKAFLLIGTDGSRTELRQVSTTTLYEAADSSHLLLDANTMILRASDGTQMTYVAMGSEYNCTQIKDRNGNFITVNYTAFSRIDMVVDSVGRSIKFNYDANGWLNSISQIWNQGLANQVTHYWAVFTYVDVPIDTNFSVTLDGPADGSTVKMLSKVTLPDNSHYDFSYTSWGQVWKVSRFAGDNHLLTYRSYNLPQTADPQVPFADCPRFTERRDWAQYWNGDTDGTAATNEEALTTYAVPVGDTWTMPDSTQQTGTRAQVTTPDLTTDKIYFVGTAGTASGWRRGLIALIATYDSSSVLQRQTMSSWEQDDETKSFVLNPRVNETNVYDNAGNRKRTSTTYQQFTPPTGSTYKLPADQFEYDIDASTVLRSTRTIYVDGDNTINGPYLSRRILGLPKEKSLYGGSVVNGGTLMTKLGIAYDETSISGSDAPVQHDPGYDATFVIGRGNLTSVKRYNVNDLAEATITRTNYNTAGSIVSTIDAANHQTLLAYTDSFADGNNSRNTLAYPTTLTDADTFTYTTAYNFDFGGVTYRRSPQPNTTQNLPGPEQTFTYDTIGRPLQVTNLANNAHTRFEYLPEQNRMNLFQTIQDTLGEALSFRITDGAGRVVATATVHPGSTGGYSGQQYVYDLMGRTKQTSNPTETNANGAPSQWLAAGDDAAVGWVYTEQTYDWKGRPLVTTNPSLTSNPAQTTTTQVSYNGCGCAGDEIITLTDEVGRIQKVHKDILGRSTKSETFNWDGTNYATTVSTFDARDLVTLVKEYSGAEGSQIFQQTNLAYDGYGRLQSQHLPEESTGTQTTWTYNADDTLNTVTDARGAAQTFGYNNRHLTTSVVYSAPVGSGISVPAQVTYAYDAAGNRTSMVDGLGTQTYQYDQLSQLTQESRQFPAGTFTINYSYNLAGQLNSLTDPFGASFTFTRNLQGQLKSLTGSPFGGVTTYITDINYRAFGEPKNVTYASTNSTIAYNRRLLPSQFRLTVNGTGSSVIREDYGYWSDANLATITDLDDTGGTNPPSTLRFLGRAYSYDQVGRVSVGHGNGGGGLAVPFYQSYGYDAFGNMTSRSGSYYNYMNANPTLTDSATYTNNRRNGWTYNANGQLTNTSASSTDKARAITYDAAGRMTSTVETGSTTTTYTASYDGDGDVCFETNTTSPGSSESAYFVRSTALDSDILTRVDTSGNKKLTQVPTFGLLIARQVIDQGFSAVGISNQNPLGTTETSRNVFDPLGNYVPFQGFGDPRPPAGSYTSASLSGLSASLANPEAYGNGCLLDGTPVNCNLAMRLVNNGSAARCPQNDCGPRFVDGRLRPLYLTEDGFGVWVERQKPKLKQASRKRGKQTPQQKAQARRKREQDAKKGNNEAKPRITKVDFDDLINKRVKIEHFDTNDERRIRAELKALFTLKCSEAFQAAGLQSPTEVAIEQGITIRPATDLINSSAAALGLVSEETRNSYRNEFFGGDYVSSSAQAGTIPSHRNGQQLTVNGDAQTYLNATAFAGESWIFSTMSLHEVLTHEFMHAGGQSPKPGLLGPLRHDLAGFKDYNKILEACR